MHPSLRATAHRPWPLESTRWAWRQTWRNLAFIHYRIAASVLRPLIPADVELEEFDGSAWIGVVPFEMYDLMRGRWPSVGPLRSFPELNIRTYVRKGGKGGVWFFSLDADCWPLVFGGRRFFNLPYHAARMTHRIRGGEVAFASRRVDGGFNFRADYAPTGAPFLAQVGTLEHWLAERYCLYTSFKGATHRVDVHHRPWPLQLARVNIQDLTMPPVPFWPPLAADPVCHFSAGVEVISFLPVPSV